VDPDWHLEPALGKHIPTLRADLQVSSSSTERSRRLLQSEIETAEQISSTGL
jgi:hypothetical protein